MPRYSSEDERNLLVDSVELLEARVHLAGNIDVAITSAGDIRIDGDNDGNTLDVTQVDENTLRFDPRGSTTVNDGEPGVPLTLDFETLRDLRISLRGGDDLITVALQSPTLRNARVNTGNQNDFVSLEGMNFTGSVNVRLGSGDVDTDRWPSGADQEVILGFDIDVEKNVALRGSRTNDKLSMDGRSGPLRNRVGGRLNMVGSGGADVVEIEDVEVIGNTSANLGSGDDTLRMQRAITRSRITFNGGSGTDAFADDGGNLNDIPVIFRNFES